MALNDFLNKAPFRLLRDMVATIKAISFFAVPMIAAGGAIAYLVSTQVESATALLAIALASLVMVAGVIAAICYYVLHVCDPAPYEITKIEGLLIIQTVNGHSYHHYINRRTQTVKARRNNVRLVEHRTHWTGNGAKNKCKSTSMVNDHTLFVARLSEEDGRTPHWVYLGRPLSKGEEAMVGIQETREDNQSPMLPYYREGGGRYRSRSLTIITRFPADEDPEKVEGLIWNNDRRNRQRQIVGKISYERKPDPTNRTVDYIVRAQKPRRYHSYGIRWSWLAQGENNIQSN
jgi:hypothetical protein